MIMLGGGEDGSMSPESGFSGEASGKLHVLLTDSDDKSEFSNEDLVEEEKLEEIMQEFYKEITSPSYNTSQPIITLPSSSSSSSSPLYLTSLPFFSASDVKSESCGASMSDSSSTVMAGIEFVGTVGKLPDGKVGLPDMGNRSPENELWVMGMEMEMGFDDNNNSNNFVGEEVMEGCDEAEFGNNQWLARVLGCGPLELEDWT